MMSRFLFLGLLALATGAVCSWALHPIKSHAGTQDQAVYVWQREWNDAVVQAVETAAPCCSGFIVLATEIGWDNGVPRTIRPQVRYDSLVRTGRPIGLGVRIGSLPEVPGGNATVAGYVAEQLSGMLAEARRAGVAPAEVQLDFDCAESKLEGYTELLHGLRAATGKIPLTITALPCWLKHSQFKTLALASDGYVLQVHSTARPKPDAPTAATCDPVLAVEWTKQASRIGRPFRVALPTYGYMAGFDRRGKLIGISAEGPAVEWDGNTTCVAVRTDASAMAGLIDGWEKDKPRAMSGVIWYRLPVETDKMNWKWVTLKSVMQGKLAAAGLKLEAVHSAPGLVDVELVNNSEVDMGPPAAVNIVWHDAQLVASDGLRGYELGENTENAGSLVRPRKAMSIIPPGGRWKVGWFRFADDAEVAVHAAAVN